MKDYFKPAGSISNNVENQNSQSNMRAYFKPAKDLVNKNSLEIKNNSIEEINDYLLTIVSGKTYSFESELGTLCSGGSIIVSLSQLKGMVEDGSYNIIKATCLNPDSISIEYQQFVKNIDNGFSK